MRNFAVYPETKRPNGNRKHLVDSFSHRKQSKKRVYLAVQCDLVALFSLRFQEVQVDRAFLVFLLTRQVLLDRVVLVVREWHLSADKKVS